MTRIHFAHANGVPSGTYAKLLTALAPLGEMTTIDLMGHDPRFPVNRGWTHLADEIAASVRRQADGQPVLGIGHSMGGLCTLIAAHRHPGLFSGIILLDPPAFNGLPGLVFGAARLLGLSDRITPAGKSLKRRSHWPDRDAVRQSLSGKALFRDFDPDCFEAYLSHGLVADAQGVRLRYRVDVEVAVFREGPWNMWAYRTPTGLPGAVITGATSEFLAMGVHQRLARQQHFQHRVTPGSHMFPLEHPLVTAALIREVVAGFTP